MARRVRPPAVESPPDTLTVQEAAKSVRMHVQTVRRWIKAGKIVAIRVGRLRIERAEWERFLAQRRTVRGPVRAPTISER